MSTRVIVIANRKGGVGKTTTAVNIAAELAARSKRVLVVDLDTQGHAALGLGVNRRQGDVGVHSVFRDAPFDLRAIVTPSAVADVDVLPAERDFQFQHSTNDPRRLAHALRPLAEAYDFIVIDTAPAIDVAMVSALVAADSLLIPTQLHHLAYDGVARFSKVLLKVATMLNRTLTEFAVVPVQVDLRANLQRLVLAKLHHEFGRQRVFPGIRCDISLAEAFGSGRPVRLYRPRSRGADDYAMLAEDVLALWPQTSPRPHNMNASATSAEAAAA